MKKVSCLNTYDFLIQGLPKPMKKGEKRTPEEKKRRRKWGQVPIAEVFRGSSSKSSEQAGVPLIFPTDLDFNRGRAGGVKPIRFIVAGFQHDTLFVKDVSLGRFAMTALVDCTGECPVCPKRGESMSEKRNIAGSRVEYFRGFLKNAKTIECAVDRLRTIKGDGSKPTIVIVCREGKKRSVGSFLLYFMLHVDEGLKRTMSKYDPSAGPMESMLAVAESMRPRAFTVKGEKEDKKTWVGVEEATTNPAEWTWAGLVYDAYRMQKIQDKVDATRYERGQAKLLLKTIEDEEASRANDLARVERDIVAEEAKVHSLLDSIDEEGIRSALERLEREIDTSEMKLHSRLGSLKDVGDGRAKTIATSDLARLERELASLETKLQFYTGVEKVRKRGEFGAPRGMFTY